MQRSSLGVVLVWAVAFVSCGPADRSGKPDVAGDYNPRLGVAVRTGARTCVAVQNSTLQPNTPITFVFGAVPGQNFEASNISGPADSPCPITKETDPNMNSYNIASVPSDLPKLTPVIAIVGPPGSITTRNGRVEADLDQNGKTETFRTCGSNDGVHLTVWRGEPLTGTVVWRGYYYEPDNPGTFPACTSAEIGKR